jgi:lipopolysaccharide export system permease protein
MRLHVYFAKRYFLAFLIVFAGLFTMLFLIQMVEQLGRFSDSGVGFGSIVTLTLLDVPTAIYRILPLVAILSAISLFVALSRSSEMVIARAAGRSAVVSVFAPVGVAVLLGVAAVGILNPIVAATSKQYEVLANRYLGTQSNVLSVTPEGLWLRQGNTTGQTVIRAARANLDGTELYEATFLSLSDQGIPIRRIEAVKAQLSPGAWILTDTKSWQIVAGENPELGAVSDARVVVPTNLTGEEIADSFGTPAAVPIWELPAQIERLERAGFSARQYRVWYQMELALPLLLGAMVFVAAGFTLRPARFGQTGLMVVMALVLGFTLYFIRNMAQILGENGQVPAALAAWGPPAAAVLLPLGLLLHLEDG